MEQGAGPAMGLVNSLVAALLWGLGHLFFWMPPKKEKLKREGEYDHCGGKAHGWLGYWLVDPPLLGLKENQKEAGQFESTGLGRCSNGSREWLRDRDFAREESNA